MTARQDMHQDEPPVLVPGPGMTLAFRAGFDRESRIEVLDLREAVYRSRSDYLLRQRPGLHPAEDGLDADSYAFSCAIGGEVVAACRYTPPRDGRWEASDLCRIPDRIRAQGSPLQISRVVVRPDVRRLSITELMLCLACRWLLERTRFDAYFALCLPALARHYEHFGARVLPGEDVRLPQRNDALYRFVHGSLERSERVLTEYLAGSAKAAWSLPARRREAESGAHPLIPHSHDREIDDRLPERV